MPTINYSYPAAFNPATYRPVFDPTGTAPTNRVTGEKHTVTASNARDFHFLVPLFAPFFAFPGALSVVFQPTTGNSLTLVEGVDYNLAFQFIGASRACAKPVYGGITLLNTALVGVFTLAYRTLGGNWTLNQPEINRILATAVVNPRVTAWEQVIDRPVLFPVIDHEWNLTDLVGAREVERAIQGIGAAIASKPVPSNSALGVHTVDFSNPHQVTKLQVGLGNVQNYPIASSSEAAEGTAGDRYMTPAGVSALMASLIDGSGDAGAAHLLNRLNPHSVTKAQVGLGNADDTSDLLKPLSTPTVDALALKASLNSPEFSGTPKSPTADAGTNSTQLATTAFVAQMKSLLTKDDVGLGGVQNYPVASSAEAIDGTATDRYMTPASTAAALLTKLASTDAGNLLQQRSNGLYLGEVAPADVAKLFIDAVAGNDAAAGTRLAPMKTMQAALVRGPANINRTLYLKEGQDHKVYPDNSAIVRGGSLSVLPYGAGLDAIPHPYGSANYALPIARDLNTSIVAQQYVKSQGGAGEWWQSAGALIGNDANINLYAITLVPGMPNPDGTNVSRQNASFGSYWYSANWQFYNCKLLTTSPIQRFFDEAFKPCNYFFISAVLQGPGKLVQGNSKMLTVNSQFIEHTQAQLAEMIDNRTTSSEVYSSFNTNILPTTMSSFPARAWAVLKNGSSSGGEKSNIYGGNVRGHASMGVGKVRVYFIKPMENLNYTVLATMSVVGHAHGAGDDNTILITGRELGYFDMEFYEDDNAWYLENVSEVGIVVYQ